MHDDLIKQLEVIFTKQQAEVYLYLLHNPGQTVYQIASELKMSRSTVYPLVRNMYNKGYLLQVSTDSQSYYAEKPKTLLMNLRTQYNDSFDLLDKSFDNYEINHISNYFMNIQSFNAVISKAKELLLNAKKEVYFNTDLDLTIFKNELDILEKNNVRIIFFCFRKQDIIWKNIDAYTFNGKVYPIPTRITLVRDKQEVLAAGLSNNLDWLGTLTNNQLMINLISEHIHHDIYLYEIQTKLHLKNLFSIDNKDNILIHSLHETQSIFIKEFTNDSSNKLNKDI